LSLSKAATARDEGRKRNKMVFMCPFCGKGFKQLHLKHIPEPDDTKCPALTAIHTQPNGRQVSGSGSKGEIQGEHNSERRNTKDEEQRDNCAFEQ